MKEFLDPNKFSTDGTTALKSCTFSEDGKLFAYMISEKGSDWAKIKVILIKIKISFFLKIIS